MSSLSLAHPTTADDWAKLLAFSQLIRPEGETVSAVHGYRERPGLSETDHAMLLDEAGEIQATASLLPHFHYFGEAELEVGELAMVGTHPERRLQGHARHLISHWLQTARTRDYAYVYVYGVPRLYDEFGFAYAAPAHHFPALQMAREVLEPVLSPYRVRPLIQGDIPLLEDLYDRGNCGTLMAEVRTHEYWMYRLARTHRGGFGWWVAVDADNHPHGYVWADLERGRLREVVAADDEACRAILQWMRWELTERKLPALTAQVPLDQRFAQYAYRSGAMVANPHALFPGNWATMVHVLRLFPLISGLKPVFERRLSDSSYRRDNFDVTFVMGEEAVNLRWVSGRVQVGPGYVGHQIRLPANVWTPLLTGYRTIDDFPHVDLSEPERHLLRAMFRAGHPYVWDLEHSDAL
ncbi:MAG: GNAT family N-acetyltransferase [Candidatus Sericytochromatia bacterium]|nr:GNAT family N-acetyltransferase [Candidatus Sericytochromatia bacterium]